MGSLKSFVKSVRAAKTLKDERNIIQKESAKIRSSFRSQKLSQRSRRDNVAKLLYLFTIGERTHFGQVECLNLLASPHFTDKRLGYLGTMLLLDENQEALMLVTNSIDNDLSHPNQYVISLALITLANIASVTMARDLFQRVETLITSSNPYLRKKAAICALRIIRRVPDYEDIFVEHAKSLLNDKNHGVLLCGVSLAIDMIDNNPLLVEHFSPCLPGILTALKQLSSNGFSPEFDVGGVPDPFLQCKLIRLLRAMGQDNEELSEQMSDLLATITTNTDNSKNVGNAVLYECVLTIFGIDTGPPQTDSGLRVLGINILAKFLSTKNINTRYSALNTLLRVVEMEPAAVQRHRQTILDCIYDPDVSIHRRALELSYVLINSQNVRLMIRELLKVLEICDAEFKPQLAFQIALNAERFAPNVKWHVDTLLKMFIHAGNHTKENLLSAFILLVINAPELQLYATRNSFAAFRKDFSQQGLNVVTLWLIGEYGDVLVKSGSYKTEGSGDETIEVSGHVLVDMILKVLASPYVNSIVQEYAINALAKLSTRLKEARDVEIIRTTIETYEISLDAEIQQRAVEYSALLGESGPLRKGILAKMPPPEFGDDLEAQHAKAMSKALIKRRRRPPVSAGSANSGSGKAQAKNIGATDDLLDLSGIGAPAGTAEDKAATSDLLNDIFGSSCPSSKKDSNSSQANGAKDDILSLFGDKALPSPVTASSLANMSSSIQPPAFQDIAQALENDDLTLSIAGQSDKPGQASLIAIFKSKKVITDLNLQIALPKSQQLTLQSLSKSSLNPGESAEQPMQINGPSGGKVKLRLRLAYKVDGKAELQQLDFAGLKKTSL